MNGSIASLMAAGLLAQGIYIGGGALLVILIIVLILLYMRRV